MKNYINGNIVFRDITERLVDKAKLLFDDHFEIDGNQIKIGFHESRLEISDLDDFAGKFSITSGTVSYSGDRGEGLYVFHSGKWIDYEAKPLLNFSNDELLEECQRRQIIPSYDDVERVGQILRDYIDNDLASAEPGYVRDVVRDICSEDEIHDLGLYEWLGFDTEED